MPLPIVLYGDPILRKKAKPLTEITPDIFKFAEQMIETMIHSKGVGLAAPQVGYLIRLFVLRDEIEDSSGRYSFSPPEVVINPEFFDPSEEMQVDLEGCLSIPKVQVKVPRPLSIHVRYQDLQGKFKTEHLKGFRARIFMHENDHLNGRLMIDRIEPQARKQIDPLLTKIKKSARKSPK